MAPLPVFTDTQGDCICYDFAPGTRGRKGQLINFGVREYEHCVLAVNLTDFLQRISV